MKNSKKIVAILVSLLFCVGFIFAQARPVNPSRPSNQARPVNSSNQARPAAPRANDPAHKRDIERFFTDYRAFVKEVKKAYYANNFGYLDSARKNKGRYESDYSRFSRYPEWTSSNTAEYNQLTREISGMLQGPRGPAPRDNPPAPPHGGPGPRR